MTWDINSSLSYGKSIDSTTKLAQGRRPEKTLGIIATKDFGKFNHKIQIIAKSKTYDKDNETGGINSGYVLLNLATNYQYNTKTKLSLNINNTTDKDYIIAQGYNQLGRTINIGVDYSF